MYLPDWDYRKEYINSLEKECQEEAKRNSDLRIADIDFDWLSGLGEDTELGIVSYGWVKGDFYGDGRIVDIWEEKYDTVPLTLDIEDDKRKILETVAANYR